MRAKNFFRKMSLGLALVLTLGTVPADSMTVHAEEIRTVASYEEAVSYVREQMVKREENVSFRSGSIDYKELSNLINDAVKYSDQCSGQEGDALHQGSSSGRISYSGNTVSCNYKINYYTTAEQEAELTGAVTEVLGSLNLQGKSSYEKVKAIYDYICTNVTYDYEHLNDESYKLKYTAYAAMCNKTAVCNGYALLFYRMCKDAGISVRMVTGIGDDRQVRGRHAWNIVKIGNSYYNVDATWDSNNNSYQWFLKAGDNFKWHYLDEEYTTEEFKAEFPMATEDYAYVPTPTVTPAPTDKPAATPAPTEAPTQTPVSGASTEIDMDADTAKYYNINTNSGTWDGTHYYLASGQMVRNSFFSDGTYTYYLQADGTPMRDRLTYHPDGKHVIYFDRYGHEVFSDFSNVTMSIAGTAVDDMCFFDTYGYMYVDTLTYDKTGTKLYYVNPYGVLERNGWFQFSGNEFDAGLGFSGTAGGYGYANSDCSLMTNAYTYDWNGNYVYIQGDGHVAY